MRVLRKKPCQIARTGAGNGGKLVGSPQHRRPARYRVLDAMYGRMQMVAMLYPRRKRWIGPRPAQIHHEIPGYVCSNAGPELSSDHSRAVFWAAVFMVASVSNWPHDAARGVQPLQAHQTATIQKRPAAKAPRRRWGLRRVRGYATAITAADRVRFPRVGRWAYTAALAAFFEQKQLEPGGFISVAP
jgi:hypothetical protein